MDSQMEGLSSATEFWTNFVQPRVAHIQRISRRDQPKEFVQARQMLDDEVAAMHLALCSLRTHRNALSPIAVLPMELLARILRLHAVDQPPSEQDLGWIRTTHVCRFWRDTALSHPTLWSNVTTELGPHWLELMLDRAKSVPLSCQLHHERYNRHFLAHILPRLSHICRLSVLLETPDTTDVTAHSLTAPAPMLDTLNLMAHDQYHHRTILPEEIFENESPMLRRLSLKNISVSWSAPVLHGLTYLRLEQDGRDRSPFSREDDFFCALNGMPTLQTLYLENVLPAGSRADDQTARLLCLQNLTIIDGGYRCLDILPKLNIPSSCRIGVHCVEFGSEDPELPDDILPLRLCEHFPATPDPFYTVSLVHDSSKRYCGLNYGGRATFLTRLSFILPATPIYR